MATIADLAKVSNDQLNRRIHSWCAPLSAYVLTAEAKKCSDIRWCPCQQHFITMRMVEVNGCRRICG